MVPWQDIYLAPATAAVGPFTQVPPADLHVPVPGQLAPAQLPLNDAFEPAPLETVGLDAPFRGWSIRQEMSPSE
jgi:hypothetical protein